LIGGSIEAISGIWFGILTVNTGVRPGGFGVEENIA
jgi:hypothetical protein